MKVWTIMLILMLITTVVFADGLTDLDLETERHLSVLGSLNGDTYTLGGSLILPLTGINSGFGIQAIRTSHEEEVISENITWRLQGGPKYDDISLQFFVEQEFGKRLDRGFFIRPVSFHFDGWDVNGGVGTYLHGVHADLHEGDDAPDLVSKPLVFVSATHGNWSFLVKWASDFQFDTHDLTIEPQFHVELGTASLVLIGKFGKEMDEQVKKATLSVDYPF